MLKCHFALKWWKEKYKIFCIQIYRDKNIEKSQPVSYSNWNTRKSRQTNLQHYTRWEKEIQCLGGGKDRIYDQ